MNLAIFIIIGYLLFTAGLILGVLIMMSIRDMERDQYEEL